MAAGKPGCTRHAACALWPGTYQDSWLPHGIPLWASNPWIRPGEPDHSAGAGPPPSSLVRTAAKPWPACLWAGAARAAGVHGPGRHLVVAQPAVSPAGGRLSHQRVANVNSVGQAGAVVENMQQYAAQTRLSRWGVQSRPLRAQGMQSQQRALQGALRRKARAIAANLQSVPYKHK